MAEYIEREALIEHMKDLPTWDFVAKADGVYEKATKYPEGMFNCDDVIASIENAPAADVVEVRHGKWIKGRKEKLYYNDDMSGFYDFPVTCSVCKFDITDEGFYETDYCPNCGAKMDGDTK